MNTKFSVPKRWSCRQKTYEDCLKISFRNSPKQGQGSNGVEYLTPRVGLIKMELHAGVDMTITLQPTKTD
jgi:hypothetical protein